VQCVHTYTRTPIWATQYCSNHSKVQTIRLAAEPTIAFVSSRIDWGSISRLSSSALHSNQNPAPSSSLPGVLASDEGRALALSSPLHRFIVAITMVIFLIGVSAVVGSGSEMHGLSPLPQPLGYLLSIRLRDNIHFSHFSALVSRAETWREGPVMMKIILNFFKLE